MLSPEEAEAGKERLASGFGREYPGIAMSDRQRQTDSDLILNKFIDFLRTKKAIGFSNDDVIACRLIEIHHWPISEARGLKRSDWPVALAADWLDFLNSLAPVDKEFLLAWQYEHGCFIEHIEEGWRRT